MTGPRFYAAQVKDSLNHGALRWRVKDRLKPGYIAIFDGIIVPGILTKAKAIEYAKRLNTSLGCVITRVQLILASAAIIVLMITIALTLPH